MKQLIVLISTIVLGVYIYNLIAGGGDSTIMAAMSEMWKASLAEKNYWGI